MGTVEPLSPLERQADFLASLDAYIEYVGKLPRFRGQSQALNALRRLGRSAVFEDAAGEYGVPR